MYVCMYVCMYMYGREIGTLCNSLVLPLKVYKMYKNKYFFNDFNDFEGHDGSYTGGLACFWRCEYMKGNESNMKGNWKENERKCKGNERKWKVDERKVKGKWKELKGNEIIKETFKILNEKNSLNYNFSGYRR